MSFSRELMTLARYLAGEFDNREQAIADPTWYVHLCLWQRPVPLFTTDSFTLFAEQASVIKLDQPYRQRILRLQSGSNSAEALQVQYYMLKYPDAFRGAGRDPSLLKSLTLEQIELLPGCTLNVSWQALAPDLYRFSAALPVDARCCFTYQSETRQVSLGFEVGPVSVDQPQNLELFSYDKGIDPKTGQGLWGALLGPFKFTKCQNFAVE